MPIQALIIGSCVTRDILHHQQQDVALVDYFARSSFASSFHPISCKDKYSQFIQSAFQRRMVAMDHEKSISNHLQQHRFDKIVVDFIDERFNLFQFPDGSLCTISNELINAGFDPAAAEGRVIASGTDEYHLLWEKGWVKFLEILRQSRLVDRLYINKVFWAKETDSGSDFAPFYSAERIHLANEFLDRLYARIARDIEVTHFLTFDQALLIGSTTHRWGPSPFHFIEEYYLEALRQMKMASEILNGGIGKTSPSSTDSPESLRDNDCADELTKYLRERGPIDWHLFTPQGELSGGHSLGKLRLSGNCTSTFETDQVCFSFRGKQGTHQAIFHFNKPLRSNGMAARLRLEGWKSIRYLALGYTHNGTFRHIKVVNPAQNQWLDVLLHHNDIAYGLQNDWMHPDCADIGDLRVYLCGEPEQDQAMIEVNQLLCWEEAAPANACPMTCAAPYSLPERKLISQNLLDVLYANLRKCFRQATAQAEAFMATGNCPLCGEVLLDWPTDKSLPNGLSEVGTYAFSWHSLHTSSILMVHAKNTGQTAPLFAAREMISDWLDSSYYKIDADKKFAWYDHGTAERQIAFLLMWAEGVERNFDQRFMTRLSEAIVRHAQLLESEQFYASHQSTRYHNHAWFQDLALMATALAFPSFPASSRWMDRAVDRLNDQLHMLIVRDNEFAVFIENSIGYHLGIQRIVELAGDMVRLTGRDSTIPDVAVELSRFSDFFRYPDNRTPAQGDTFRRSSLEEGKKLKPYPEPSITLLSKAGYGIVKGNHANAKFMFTLFATSLCRTHKHQDDLSFTLFFDGIEWLIDPSFFSHEYLAPIPAYLRSSAAHNTLHLPGVAYSIDPGKSVLAGSIVGTDFSFSGHHVAFDGYRISRSVNGSSQSLNLSFTDEITAEQAPPRPADLMLHCGEGVTVKREHSHAVLSHPDSRFELHISLPGGPNPPWAVHSGVVEGDHVRGVTGTAFMQHQSIATIQCPVTMGLPLAWTIEARPTA